MRSLSYCGLWYCKHRGSWMLDILFYHENESERIDMKMNLLTASAFLIHSHIIVLCTFRVWILELQQSKIVFASVIMLSMPT